MRRPFLIIVVCLCVLFSFASAQAQEPENAPSLEDAKTVDDVNTYIRRETDKILQQYSQFRDKAIKSADILIPASDKALEIAKNDGERKWAYHLKIHAFNNLKDAGVEGAEQKLETLLDELAAKPEFKDTAVRWQFQMFRDKTMRGGGMLDSVDTFKAELKTWIDRGAPISSIVPFCLAIAERNKFSDEQLFAELIEYVQSAKCTLSAEEKENVVTEIKDSADYWRFRRFINRAWMESIRSTPERYNNFVAELKTWVDKKDFPIDQIISGGQEVLEHHGVPIEQLLKELVEHIRSPECPLPAEEKEKRAMPFVGILRLAAGGDLKLYGRTLDDKEFKWESLVGEKEREKYVLVKFTATWCVPCNRVLPDMLELYEKYHDKGFEIVSVYIWQREEDPVALVKKHVEDKKLPWIIISEALTEKAKQPKQGDFYAISNFITSQGVPTMVLACREGKVILTDAQVRADNLKGLKTKLAEIFE